MIRVGDETIGCEAPLHARHLQKLPGPGELSIALALRLNAPIFASEELLDHTAEDVGQTGEEGTTEYDAEDLKEYLRRMNPEDFGRFTM